MGAATVQGPGYRYWCYLACAMQGTSFQIPLGSRSVVAKKYPLLASLGPWAQPEPGLHGDSFILDWEDLRKKETLPTPISCSIVPMTIVTMYWTD